MRNLLLYRALLLAARLLPRVPLVGAYALAVLASQGAFLLARAPRDALLGNLAAAFPTTTPAWRRLTGRRAFANNARNWVDTLRIPTLTPEQIRQEVAVDGWEHLEAALAEGRGVVIVSMHLGNFDLVGQVLAARGVHLTVPVERIEPPELYALLTRDRESKGITTTPLDRAPRVMVRALGRGEVVGILADRPVAGKTFPVSYLGRNVPLPAAPATLARHHGSRMLVGIGVREGVRRYRGVLEPLELEIARDSDEREIVAALAAVMERFVRLYPAQWLAFWPMVDSGTVETLPATIGRPRAAR